MSWKSREGKAASQLLKDIFSLNGLNSEWSGPKSDYRKLRGGENVELVGIDFSLNKFRNEGKWSLDGMEDRFNYTLSPT